MSKKKWFKDIVFGCVFMVVIPFPYDDDNEGKCKNLLVFTEINNW